MLLDGAIENSEGSICDGNFSGEEEKIEDDNDGGSTCSSNDTNTCIEFFLGLKKNTITLNDMKDVNIDSNDDDGGDDDNCGSSSSRLDCFTNEHRKINNGFKCINVKEVNVDDGKKSFLTKNIDDVQLLIEKNYEISNESNEIKASPTTTRDEDNHLRTWFTNAYRTDRKSVV